MGFSTDTKFGIILGLKKSDFFIENDFFVPLSFSISYNNQLKINSLFY
jgi:hypothetical protein